MSSALNNYPSTQSAPLSLSLVAQATKSLARELPLNDFGLPTGIYRADLLPMHEYDPNYQVFGSVGEDAALSTETMQDVAPESYASSVMSQAVTDDSVSQLLDIEAPGDSSPADPFLLLSGQGDGLPDVYRPTQNSEVPVTTNGVPYRIAGFPAKSLASAFVPLHYDEGFPAFDSGQAFWQRLSYEPPDAYLAFERYLQLSFGGEANDTNAAAASGTRALSSLVLLMQPQLSDEQLLSLTNKYQEYYHVYYWGLRARAYDLFRVTQYRQQQEIRALETQDDHYIQSRKLRSRLTEYMDSEEDFWDLMTPKVAIDMFKQLTTLERISAGVPAAGPAVDSDARGQTFEVAFRTTAQKHAGESLRGDILNEDGVVLDKALEDPATIEILQELIIKGSKGA